MTHLHKLTDRLLSLALPSTQARGACRVHCKVVSKTPECVTYVCYRSDCSHYFKTVCG